MRIYFITCRWILYLTLIAVAASFVGCSSSDTPTEPPTKSSLEKAWGHFEAGEYSDAISSFRSAVDEDGSLTDGYNGLGWSFAFSGMLDSASGHLSTAVSQNADLIAPLACLSAVRLAQGDYDDAITRANEALSIDGSWVFSHRGSIDYRDMHLILAEAYFRQGESSFPDAQAQVDILDPVNGLDPNDSQTWSGYPTYSAALLKVIQTLEEQIGADMLL